MYVSPTSTRSYPKSENSSFNGDLSPKDDGRRDVPDKLIILKQDQPKLIKIFNPFVSIKLNHALTKTDSEDVTADPGDDLKAIALTGDKYYLRNITKGTEGFADFSKVRHPRPHLNPPPKGWSLSLARRR
ncbi:hypothetical protein RF11_15377 [Thelohanellus kitauei]|uniref:Uncharacterized protein n=1 Tax=Thelohanellus kitauei TaxID=669202 RepID=A0A0C2LZU3_THEKT|nr:hypothetical protein RF11_15377 [Thelohanellus kitauei]